MDDLQERIAAELIRVLAHQARTGVERPPGIVALVDEDGVPRLSVDDVARIAARVLEDTAGEQVHDQPGEPSQSREPA